MSRPSDVLSYWFGQPASDHETLLKKIRRWYMGGPTVDAEIKTKFGDVVEQALEGGLEEWRDEPKGALALVIVLDQFPRSVYRNDPRSYAGDARAQRLAAELLDAGIDKDLGLEERLFVHMPLLHAENLALQERVCVLQERLVADAPEPLRPLLSKGVEQSRKYREIIARFGRFPHRNEILGRTSTGEEIEFLKTWSERARPSGMDDEPKG